MLLPTPQTEIKQVLQRNEKKNTWALWLGYLKALVLHCVGVDDTSFVLLGWHLINLFHTCETARSKWSVTGIVTCTWHYRVDQRLGCLLIQVYSDFTVKTFFLLSLQDVNPSVFPLRIMLPFPCSAKQQYVLLALAENNPLCLLLVPV